MIKNYMNINGLTFYPNLLTESQQLELITEIDKRPCCNDLRRRTQHYGYKYDYRNRKIDSSMDVGPLPDFAFLLAHKLQNKQLTSSLSDQMIVNEYVPGQGIAQHVDCVPCFNDEIVTISLGSVYSMRMTSLSPNKMKQSGVDFLINFDLELGSALVFSGESRYNWTHGILPVKMDGDRLRGRRISLTFRKVILT